MQEISTKKKWQIKGKEQDGKLMLNLKGLEPALREFKGMDILVSLEKWKKTRSNPQNRYYWGVVVKHTIQAIKDQWGDILTPDEAHSFIKSEILGEMRELNGYSVKIPQSTKTDTATFEENMEGIRNFIQRNFNYTIPLPNEEI